MTLQDALSQTATDYGYSNVDDLWSMDPEAYDRVVQQYQPATPALAATPSLAPVATAVSPSPTEPAVAKAPDSGAETAPPSWYKNPFQQYVTQQVTTDRGDGSWTENVQVLNPQWKAYEDAAKTASTTPTGIADSPWAMDAAAFHAAVDPLLQKTGSFYDPNFVNTKAYEHAINYNPVGQLYSGSPQTLGWSSPEGQRGSVSLQLANGKTWTPSGASSGITFHPAGETTVAEGGGVAVNPYDYYEVSGDMSALLGQDGSNVHQNVKYVERDGKMVPIDAPNVWNYSNNGFFGDMAPVLAIGALALGVPAIAGWASEGAAAVASGATAGAAADTAAMAGVMGATAASGAAPLASGVAGMFGMEAGLGATALNAGAMQAGINLAAGGDLESALKAGAMGAALSPVGGWASDTAKSLLPAGTSTALSNAVGTVAQGAAQGAAGAALTGNSIGDGLVNGIKTGLINSAGQYVGSLVTDATDSKTLGGAASGGVSAALAGRNVGLGLLGGAIDGYTEVPGLGTLAKTVIDKSEATTHTTPSNVPATKTKRSIKVNMGLFSGFDTAGWAGNVKNSHARS